MEFVNIMLIAVKNQSDMPIINRAHNIHLLQKGDFTSPFIFGKYPLLS